MTYIDLQSALSVGQVLKVQDKKIKLGKFNFNTGCVEQVSFTVHYVAKLAPSKLYAYGIVHYDNGDYKCRESLYYTNLTEMFFDVDTSFPTTSVEDAFEILRKY